MWGTITRSNWYCLLLHSSGMVCPNLPLDCLIENGPLQYGPALNLYLNICGLAALEFELALKRLDKGT
jgi:hypothetical protein